MSDKENCDEKEVKNKVPSKKNSVIIDINPTMESVDLLKFDKTIVFTFLKFSPATVEHDKFIDSLYDIAVDNGVEMPLVFIQQNYPQPQSVDDEESEFYYIDPKDALMLAQEAYGDIVQTNMYVSLYDLLRDLRDKYTDIIAVLPESYESSIKGNPDFPEVRVIEYPDFDEDEIASDMFELATSNPDEFRSKFTQYADYLADDFIEIYSLMDDEVEVDEALTYSQRIKRGNIFRRNKQKVALARERMRHKIATNDQLKKRARHQAIIALRKKVAGSKGLDYNNLPVGEKVNIDKRVEQRKGAIARIAAKLLPTLRKKELTKNTTTKTESVNIENLPSNKARVLGNHPEIEEDEKKESVKRNYWHMLHHPNGTVKFDKRFKIWRNVNDVHEAVEIISSVMEDKELQDVIESLSNKAEEYNIPLDVVKEVFARGMVAGNYSSIDPIQEGFQRLNSFIAGNYFIEDVSLMERAEAESCALITKKDLDELEKFADSLLDKFGIDIEFTKHFGERMSDDRNNPCITVKELRDFFRKIAMKQGKDIKNAREAQVVLKDIQKDLNIPVVIDYNRGEFEVTLKTIMRKKNFTTPNPIVKI